MSKNVLLIEDETDIARLIELHLQDADMRVTHCDNGEQALQLALSSPGFDFLILDLRLPGLSGLEVCRQIRRSGSALPILMLTARSSELERIHGLQLGADDYLTKPFSPLELVARVKAILRRVGQSASLSEDSESEFQLGRLSVNMNARSVQLDSQAIQLTAREFDLLLHFCRNPHRVFSRAELLDSVWGYGHDGYEHTVNSHINRLRRKIERDSAQPDHIITVWGVGYKFQPGGVPA